jgi:hypothetical protein
LPFKAEIFLHKSLFKSELNGFVALVEVVECFWLEDADVFESWCSDAIVKEE